MECFCNVPKIFSVTFKKQNKTKNRHFEHFYNLMGTLEHIFDRWDAATNITTEMILYLIIGCIIAFCFHATLVSFSPDSLRVCHMDSSKLLAWLHVSFSQKWRPFSRFPKRWICEVLKTLLMSGQFQSFQPLTRQICLEHLKLFASLSKKMTRTFNWAMQL